MQHVAGVFQGRLASMTLKFAAKVFSFCLNPRKRSLGTYDDSSSTSRAVSVTRKAYVSPYERCIQMLERLLSLPCIASIVYPLLIDENAHSADVKDPVRPLRVLFARGCTLNILVNELESPFIATIDLYERAGDGSYESHQIELFWRGCVDAGLVSEEKLMRVQDRYNTHDSECLELMLVTVSVVLDQLLRRGRCGLVDPRYIKPRDIYPTVHTGSGAPRYAVLAAELSRTEVAYVQDLERLVEYADSASAQIDDSEVDFDAIFGNIRAILALHRTFSKRIQYLAAMPLSLQLFGAAYDGLLPMFDVYSRFCASRECSQRAFARAVPVLKLLDSELDAEFDIPSLLIRPVQRLAQYPLLFQSIVDAMCEQCATMAPADQAEHVHVVKAAYAAVDHSKHLLTRANETTREAVNETQQAQFAARLADAADLQGLGRLLTSGPVSAQAGREFEDMEAYLFESTLVVCSASSTQGSRAARIRRTISSLHVTIKSPRRRDERRRSGSSVASSTLHSPVLGGCSPESGFQLPNIDAGCALSLNSQANPLSSPANTPLNSPLSNTPLSCSTVNNLLASGTNPLASHSSLSTLRERPLVKFATLDTETDAALARLTVRERVPTSAISQVSQLSEVDGSLRLNIQAMLNDGSDAMLVFRRLSREAAGVWTRMLQRAVPLVPVEESVARANDNYCLLVNPRFAPLVLGRKIQ
ncbi:Guanine nucleotide exchange factor for Cdc42p [Coemansia sp. RSA 1938]|nr:Guanine nucleotide exchange factor for Cdc42p [Coemansia sp. RSA 1938]